MRSLLLHVLATVLLISAAVEVGTGRQDAPEVKKRVNPWYPALMKAAGIEGETWLKVLINEQGLVEKADVLKSTDAAFSDAAIQAVKQWEFTPSVKDGKPIKAEVTIPFRFALAKDSLKSKHEDLLLLQGDIRKFLCGGSGEVLHGRTAASASLILGSQQEDLATALSDAKKRGRLAGGAGCTISATRSLVSEGGDMAYFMVQTRSQGKDAERFHTLLLLKGADGKWKIAAWQAGA